MSLEMLRALAHPTRRRILRVLPGLESARASDVARTLDIPVNQASFHLRTLGAAGLIQEAPEAARDRRDRVWRATPGTLSLGSPDAPMSDPELAAAVEQGYLDDHLELVRRVNAQGREYQSGRDRAVHGTMQAMTARLTEEEFIKVISEFSHRVEELTLAHRRDDVGVRTWQLHLVAGDDQAHEGRTRGATEAQAMLD